MSRKISWVDLWLLYLMAEHFELKILYTPLIPYLADYEKGENAYLEHLTPIVTDFSQNHIPYIHEQKFNSRIIFDSVGAKRAKTKKSVQEKIKE